MRDAARLAAMDLPDDNFHFRRGWSWHIPDRLPNTPPRRRPVRTIEHLAAEIAADHRHAVRGRA